MKKEVQDDKNEQQGEGEDGREGEGEEALERPARHEGQAEQGDEEQGQPLREALHQRKAQGRQPVSSGLGGFYLNSVVIYLN